MTQDCLQCLDLQLLRSLLVFLEIQTGCVEMNLTQEVKLTSLLENLVSLFCAPLEANCAFIQGELKNRGLLEKVFGHWNY